LIHLSTVTVSKSSNQPWVNIESARWVNIQSARTHPSSPPSLVPKYRPKNSTVPPFLPFNHNMRNPMIALKNIYFYRKFASKAEIAGLLGTSGRAKERRWNVYECASH
jgi:hypothetical protein